ncbi:MAG: hypothetical protein OET44_08510 [Gammaproteobacteria bacterium]|nr:hypothetical protein [Gammaproteobacteria bacterium]
MSRVIHIGQGSRNVISVAVEVVEARPSGLERIHNHHLSMQVGAECIDMDFIVALDHYFTIAIE